MKKVLRKAVEFIFKHLKRATKWVLGIFFILLLVSLVSVTPIPTLALIIETVPVWAGVALLLKWNSEFVSSNIPISERFISYYSRWLLAICLTILSLLNSAFILIYSMGSDVITTYQFSLVMSIQFCVYTIGFILIYYITDRIQDEWPPEGTYLHSTVKTLKQLTG